MTQADLIEQLLNMADLAAQMQFVEKHDTLLSDETAHALKSHADHLLRTDIQQALDIANLIKQVAENSGTITAEGPKGKLDYKIPAPITVEISDSQIKVLRPSDAKEHMSLHGLVRTLIFNMITGVKDGYTKELEIRGVGYKAQVQGQMLTIALGFSHPIEYQIPEGVTIETPKPTIIIVKSIDKAKVGVVAAELRDFYKPEPYKGKGIRYAGEYVRHKAGKTVA